jgi:diaminohydroxyphosphoribosylaminopyrimidine deaminase/5-amino-6-(5-phosphoribosylamino)uracil reductase
VKFAFENNLQSIIIEGGAHTLQTFIDNNLWDEARVFIGANILEIGKKAPVFKSKLSNKTSFLEDELLIFKNND